MFDNFTALYKHLQHRRSYDCFHIYRRANPAEGERPIPSFTRGAVFDFLNKVCHFSKSVQLEHVDCFLVVFSNRGLSFLKTRPESIGSFRLDISGLQHSFTTGGFTFVYISHSLLTLISRYLKLELDILKHLILSTESTRQRTRTSIKE
ncbi:hypothetical protein RRG08_013774 [Elysia crispata]|uniref:Uncharacterized protein n=1 Tax=Elysia crispata TaxID=231223 RepID=A0AAE1DSR6_9GAST|nr:hypothetical protein RRG08_013774 [Elysia crispata]